jgi:pimeloyl-ACP methyl ester carboxylesterase
MADGQQLMAIQWREKAMRGNGVSLHVRLVVEPSAPPALLLHGLGVGGSVFQPFARRLLPHLAAVVPDLRGHGQSDSPLSAYALADHAADLVELISNELQPPVPVVGHSLGALVGLELARLRPDVVAWLALLDPPLDPERPNRDIGTIYRLRHAAPGGLETYLLGRYAGGRSEVAEILGRLFRQASDGAFEAMLAAPPYEVKPLATRTLVVQADTERGGVLGDAAAKAAVDRLGNATLVKIAGAPHALQGSHPAEVAQAILEFGGYSSGGDSSR